MFCCHPDRGAQRSGGISCGQKNRTAADAAARFVWFGKLCLAGHLLVGRQTHLGVFFLLDEEFRGGIRELLFQ